MESEGKYIVEARENYATMRFTNFRKACKYARSITDSTNPSTMVWEELPSGANKHVAWWRYTPQVGGRTYRACI